MNQTERVAYLIEALMAEQPRYRDLEIPTDEHGKQQLLRALMNVRSALPIDKEFLAVQDAYLQEVLAKKGVVEVSEMPKMRERIYLWQGDITRLRVGAIVNAANSGMTGCYHPCHGCIDNAIHTFSGIQLRLACEDIMQTQGHAEPTGSAKITKAYNLPSDYVLHTVGPIISGRLTKQDEILLQSCYRSCLALAAEYGIRSLAFCCISTGEFRFPNQRAAEIAVQTVLEYLEENNSDMEVIFNVFKDQDHEIYRKLLGAGGAVKK